MTPAIWLVGKDVELQNVHAVIMHTHEQQLYFADKQV